MDYEKKYRDLIKRLKEERDGDNDYEPFCHVANDILDEFGENGSEDERIRKTLYDEIKNWDASYRMFKTYSKESFLAYLEKQKEQKPAEIDVKALLTADRLASAEMTGRLKERSEILENPEKYGLCKPAEWSEEDETAYNDLMWCIEQARKSAKDENDMGNVWFAENWVKNRLKSLRPQPHSKIKFEPEEGDIVTNKDGVIAVFESWGHHPDGGSFNDHSCFFAKCTLDGDYYDDIDCCQDSYGLRYATPEEIRKFVPHLLAYNYPQPHWKPSEEQMDALLNTLHPDDPYYNELKSLYEQLKKL